MNEPFSRRDASDLSDDQVGGVATLIGRQTPHELAGPVPLQAMQRTITRNRRRRRLAAVGASVAAVGAVAFAVPVITSSGSGDDSPAVAATTDELVVPEGTRLTGVGRIAVAVPEDFGINEVRCNAATANTVIIEPDGAYCAPGAPAAPLTSVVEFLPPNSPGPSSGAPLSEVEIDGVTALRSDDCGVSSPGSPDAERSFCTAQLTIPGEGSLLVISTQVPQSAAEADIDALIGNVRVLDEHVGVPPVSGDLDAFTSALEDLGLVPQVSTGNELDPGQFIRTTPEPGTIVAVGSSIQVDAR